MISYFNSENKIQKVEFLTKYKMFTMNHILTNIVQINLAWIEQEYEDDNAWTIMAVKIAIFVENKASINSSSYTACENLALMLIELFGM